MTPFSRARWGLPWAATLAGVKQVYAGRIRPGIAFRLITTEGGHLHAWRTDSPTDCCSKLRRRKADLGGLKMVIGGSELHQGVAKQALGHRIMSRRLRLVETGRSSGSRRS